MIRLIPLAVLLCLLFAGGAHAQQEVNLYCYNGTRFVPASTAAPCPVTAVITGQPLTATISMTPITPIPSAAPENNHVLKASAGSLYSVYASNLTGGTTGNLLVFNLAAAPVDGAVTPLDCVPFNSNGVALVSYYGGPPATYANGIVAVVSSATSCFTKTTGVLTAYIHGVVQ